MTTDAVSTRGQSRTRWIAWLFIIGSALFGLGATPYYSEAVGLRACALTFFVGSLFFTAAAFLQYREAVDALPIATDPRRRRFWVWAPRNIAWLACAVQLAGTLWFNWSTANALRINLSVEAEDQRVWRPDALGSIAFLFASGLALMDARRGVITGQPKPVGVEDRDRQPTRLPGVRCLGRRGLRRTERQCLERRGVQPRHARRCGVLSHRRDPAAGAGQGSCPPVPPEPSDESP